MVDPRSVEQRRKIMQSVGTANTGPEMAVRRVLYALGYRYRLHRKDLPGKPDIVFVKKRKVIFVHGCFWHGHGCPKGRLPKSRLEYWGPKIDRNRQRDREAEEALGFKGWDVLTVWQCELKDLHLLGCRLSAFLGPRKKTDRHLSRNRVNSTPRMKAMIFLAEGGMQMTRPIGIDLFAGAGGMSLGFEQAGFDVVAAVEIDPIHAAVHSYNFPNCVVIPQSVSSLTAEDIRDTANIGLRNVDIVFGGAPCQGFSLMGQRALDDPRNSLVKDFVRIVVGLESSYFVFENVKGITVGRHKQFLAELIEEFQSNGYDVLPWRVLNAANYGVPQERERLILIGAKRGLKLPEYPEPTTRSPRSSLLLDAQLPEGPSCQDALGDIPDAEDYEALIENDSTAVNWGRPSAYARILRDMVAESTYYGYKRKWNKELLTSSLRTNHSEISRARFASTEMGQVEPTSRFFKLHANGVSNTLRAGTDSARGAFTSPRPIHYKYPRCITVREMLRLHGFPDWFRTHVTKWHGARQVGNAVPPPLARAVAASIIDAIGWEPSSPTGAILMGDERLLSMDMGQASRHFEINVPIKQRDRKGTPKPRQSATQPA